VHKNRYIFILYFLTFTCSSTYSQEFSYLLPDTGYQALVQKKIDLRGGLVILSIALAPGFEDLPTLAYYRLKQGVKIGCLYFTNGEDVPNYEYGKTSYETAKQRKEEAYQVMSVLGGEAFFLNVPALSLRSLENTSLIRERYANKLETIISEMKPDVILVNSDYFFPDGKSNRIQLLRILLEQTAAQLKKNNQWNDFKIFIQTEDNTRGDRIPVFETNSLNKKSYFEIANDIRSTYKSMLKLFPVWTASYWPCYTTVFPKQNCKIKLSKINHPLIPQTLQTINLSIKKIVESEEDHLSVSYLNRLQSVIQIIDGHINNSRKNRNLNSREVRLLLFWKKAIEDLRCAIHNVTLHYVLRDKSVTASQVFFVKIGPLGTWAKNGKTQLIFPGVVQKKWIVDTRQEYSYPLLADTSWLVISPNNFQLTAPVNEEGYKSLQMRNMFTFMVVHKGSHLRDNFVYQRDIPLLSVPHQSIEILKPDVIANRDSIVLVKITNNLFNAIEGDVLGEDSVVAIMPHHISLPAKAVTIDSLRLNWKKKYIGGEQQVSLKNKRERSIGSITYRGLEIKTEHSVPVGVLSVIDHTPLLGVLRYIGCTVIPLDTIEKSEFKKISAIIFDEQTSVKLRSNMVAQNQLKDWIRDGGTMVMFSQYGPDICPVPDDSVTFQYHNAVLSHQDIMVDINQWSNKNPNIIDIHDLYNEGSIISFGGIQIKANLSVNIPLQIKSTKMPLIVTRKYGQGNIIYIALHLYPQILSIQPETYKLFVNLLSN
jgi:LmbE family N-acetylglucosaminyl deacetylase